MGNDLIVNLYRIFGLEKFDVTDVWCAAQDDARLTAALDVEVPRARYKSRWNKGELNRRAIRMALRRTKGLRVMRTEDYYAFGLLAEPGSILVVLEVLDQHPH
jgi:hypothetical protein